MKDCFEQLLQHPKIPFAIKSSKWLAKSEATNVNILPSDNVSKFKGIERQTSSQPLVHVVYWGENFIFRKFNS